MKAGAIDFLTKPVHEEVLLDAIARVEKDDAQVRQTRAEATLTPREREVLSHVVADRLNKQIAADWGTEDGQGALRSDHGEAGAAFNRRPWPKGRHFVCDETVTR